MELKDERNDVEVLQMQTETLALNKRESYDLHLRVAQQLQSDAWTAFNDAFHAPEAEEYRRAGRELYERVIHERLTALCARGDEQNALLDARVNA